ncbi:hypothetical protein AGMMS4957_13530 [Bacteroidia bacterium]|nr:hypothetical protein AGMMS4957_13530 [Bacteroidia bacterium]
MYYIGVKEVEPQSDYTLLLTFENGEQRKFDMNPYLNIGPVFWALKDPDMFNTVRVCSKTVAWANEVDLDPEMLYPNSTQLV